MASCASVKKKGSTDQCSAKALRGHTLCGIHARAKHVTLWSDVHKNTSTNLQKFQAIVRGWLVRRRLKYAGPGVLSRKNLANDEDLETCEEASRVYPFNYFAFEENGKIWWFQFPTLWKWCLRSAEPTNPYTKVPLTQDTRKRIRAIWGYNRRHKISLPEEPNAFEDRLLGRWNIICQLFTDYGFGNIDPHMFLHMRKNEYLALFQFLRDDIEMVYPGNSKVKKLVIRNCNLLIYHINNVNSNIYALSSCGALMTILLYPKDPYILAFTVLSALYRA